MIWIGISLKWETHVKLLLTAQFNIILNNGTHQYSADHQDESNCLYTVTYYVTWTWDIQSNPEHSNCKHYKYIINIQCTSCNFYSANLIHMIHQFLQFKLLPNSNNSLPFYTIPLNQIVSLLSSYVITRHHFEMQI